MNASHDATVRSVRHARRLRDRLRGLLGLSALPPGEILSITPCSSIHTFGMRFAIDIAFVGRDGTILRIDRSVAPWRVRLCPSARTVLEMTAGGADRMGLEVGRRWQDGGAR